MPLAVKRAALFSQVTIFQGKKMIEADRLIAPENPAFRDEDVIDRAIRPKKLADYQGQDHVRDQMEIFIKAAQLRSEALDHLLILVPQVWVKPHLRISLPMKWK